VLGFLMDSLSYKKPWQEEVAVFKDQFYEVAKCVHPCGTVENGEIVHFHVRFHEGN
jgi:hypothetical protein